jgi:hypothetical protein
MTCFPVTWSITVTYVLILRSTKFSWMIFKNSVRTSKETHCICITVSNNSVLFTKIINIYSEVYEVLKYHMLANVEPFNFRAGVIYVPVHVYNNKYALKGICFATSEILRTYAERISTHIWEHQATEAIRFNCALHGKLQRNHSEHYDCQMQSNQHTNGPYAVYRSLVMFPFTSHPGRYSMIMHLAPTLEVQCSWSNFSIIDCNKPLSLVPSYKLPLHLTPYLNNNFSRYYFNRAESFLWR